MNIELTQPLICTLCPTDFLQRPGLGWLHHLTRQLPGQFLLRQVWSSLVKARQHNAALVHSDHCERLQPPVCPTGLLCSKQIRTFECHLQGGTGDLYTPNVVWHAGIRVWLPISPCHVFKHRDFMFGKDTPAWIEYNKVPFRYLFASFLNPLSLPIYLNLFFFYCTCHWSVPIQVHENIPCLFIWCLYTWCI